MKLGTLPLPCLFVGVTLLGAGCAPVSNEESTGTAVQAIGSSGGIIQASGFSTADSFATGASTGGMLRATTFVITKYQATVRQRQVAEKRARAAQARLTERNERHLAADKRAPAQRKAAAKKRLPRYIAVDTEKDQRASPKADKAVMIWDTQSEQIVGNNVYDIDTPPAVGSTAVFETYSAQYVATGL